MLRGMQCSGACSARCLSCPGAPAQSQPVPNHILTASGAGRKCLHTHTHTCSHIRSHTLLLSHILTHCRSLTHTLTHSLREILLRKRPSSCLRQPHINTHESTAYPTTGPTQKCTNRNTLICKKINSTCSAFFSDLPLGVYDYRIYSTTVNNP